MIYKKYRHFEILQSELDRIKGRRLNAFLLFLISLTITSCGVTRSDNLIIKEQGSFAVGGTVKKSLGTFDPVEDGAFNPSNQSTAGQTLHGDHATVFYQVPTEARNLPLIFWHGYGQSMRTWQTTPDGREGFHSIFLKYGYPVYLIDQPRRGLAGRSTEPASISASTDEQLWFGIFRLGQGTEFYPGVQFSKDPEALNQFYRQMAPDTGPLDIQINIEAVSALFNKIGPGILVTHSHSGGQGWLAALKNNNIKAIASFEPGSNFVFPEGDVPPPMPYMGGQLRARRVSMEAFKSLTKIPIIIYYGDNIPESHSQNPGKDQWRAAVAMAKKWRDTVNKYGGDVTLVQLPKIGLKGNTHFAMSDLNNKKVAEHLFQWMKEKGLD